MHFVIWQKKGKMKSANYTLNSLSQNWSLNNQIHMLIKQCKFPGKIALFSNAKYLL